jgi:hypothetical protein
MTGHLTLGATWTVMMIAASVWNVARLLRNLLVPGTPAHHLASTIAAELWMFVPGAFVIAETCWETMNGSRIDPVMALVCAVDLYLWWADRGNNDDRWRGRRQRLRDTLAKLTPRAKAITT